MLDNIVTFETCRPVEDHARRIMEWRNDPTTLAMSFHQDPKVWDRFFPEFRDGYFGQLDDPKPCFALMEGQRVAFLRFQRTAHPEGLHGTTVEISINVDPGERGRGVGKSVLAAALRHLRQFGVDSVVADVRRENSVSLAAFAGAGYREFGPVLRHVADTGEACPVVRFVAELTDTRWRRGGVYVIAEAGSNWRMGTPARDRAMARALIDVAVEAGADAVKFQTYRPETVYVANSGESDYLAEAGIKEDISAIFADLAMPYEMIPELAAYCRDRGIDFMSTPFSPQDFAAIDPHVSVHKVASYEISHLRLLELAARSGKPLVLSTGASDEADIAWAVDTYRAAGGRDLCLLQCTAKYPAPLDSMNMAALATIKRRFGVAVGLSDHSRSPSLAPVMAVALGGRVIEKHYTLDNRLPGPDHSFALTPAELSQLVRDVRSAEAALGDGVKRVLEAEGELAAFARRGLQAIRDVAPGDVLREGENFAILRPGKQRLGEHPRHIARFEGRRAARSVRSGSGLSLADVE